MPGSSDPDRDLNERLRDLERMLDAVEVSADDDDDVLLHRLEEATADLHALLGGSIADARNDRARADLDAAVEHVLRSFVAEHPVPLVVRQHLLSRPLLVDCTRDELLHAVRRALAVCASHAAPGSTLDVATGEDGDEVVLRIACDDPGHALPERAVTLRAFAKQLRGRCAIATDSRGAVTLSLSFPHVLERR